MLIHCCGCDEKIEARLTNGGEIYHHRNDLSSLPFWKCDTCGNFVGCHHKTDKPTRPLGCIPTPEIRNARKHIHAKLDPIWQSGKISRNQFYKKLSEKLGWKYHTANIRSVEEAREVYKAIDECA
ncbi:MAG: hypothetical protein JKX92_15340 [Porticoccaceae bacterium]|nr:hypothetical protein [Porticoccaceae bacterium]